MRSLWILIVVAGIAVAKPFDVQLSKIGEALRIEDERTRNSILENLILDLLENMRNIMLNGNEDIPVLDPLQVDSITVTDQDLPVLPGLRVSLSDLSVSKMSTFVIDSLSLNGASLLPLRYRLQLEGHIPDLLVEVGKYDLDAPVFGANIFGNGDGRFEIVEPRITANILVAPRFTIFNGIFISLVDCDIRFTLGSFEPQLTGLMGDDAVTDFVNLFLKNLLPELVEFFEDDIAKFLSSTVLEVGNEILADLNLGSILG